MRSLFILSCSLFVFFFCRLPISGQTSKTGSNDEGAKAAVEAVLRTQQVAWNRHDLEGFMAGYWNSRACALKCWAPMLLSCAGLGC